MNFAPPSPAEPPPLSIPTVVAPAAGVPVVTPSVPALPLNVSSNAPAFAQIDTARELPQVPGNLDAQ